MDGGPRTNEEAELRERLDLATRLLCELCTKLVLCDRLEKKRTSKKLITGELADWWKKHQEQDRLRLAAEAEERERTEAKERALSKLSAEDRKALDLPAIRKKRPKRKR